ncbi:MAG TPA: thioredoxin domain-containing protein [Stellaceae bacterium]|nr:thioredoxin domain-containing protein [Stellaceae bacterium]
MLRNALALETSPYLLQHKDNPVHWQGWSQATLDLAKREEKPILLSVGYAACHWCHVMAQECFENPEIAALMNRLFVNIKVDREERPDLDTIYQQALALMGEQGGWPLTMFLTPSAEPFWGGTYFPPQPRWGRPGFPEVLQALARAYQEDRATVTQNVAALKQGLQRLARPQAGTALSLALNDQIAERLLREVDPDNGGIGTAPKFPQTGLFQLFWHGWKRRGAKPLREAVLNALDHMAEGGLYDHIGGGFARYTVDAHWLVPHFEKMLYDNALLIELLTDVWLETPKPLYAARVAETIEWLTREMLTSEGGFASSIDADSEHEEGKFYVWSAAEIDQLLGPRAAKFKEAYGVSEAGNWEGHNILNRLAPSEPLTPAEDSELAAARAVLFHAREERVHPGLDDKVLADWNGLLIASLARAALVFERPDWLDLAEEAFQFITIEMSDDECRLFHSFRAGVARHQGMLDDYATMSRAALALFEATGEESYFVYAKRWVEIVDRHFWDADGGGYFFTSDEAENLIARTKTAQDSPNPAGNAVFVEVLATLFYLTGEDRYRRRAEAIVTAFAGELQRNIFGYGTLLNAHELLEQGVQIVIIGPRRRPDTEALRRAALHHPSRILVVIPPDRPLPASHPAFGKTEVAGRATAYVCRGQICSLPLTDATSFRAELDKSPKPSLS